MTAIWTSWLLQGKYIDSLLFFISLCDAVVHIPLWAPGHGCDGCGFPEGPLCGYPTSLPWAAGQGEADSHQDPAEAPAKAGRQCLPLLLWSEQAARTSIQSTAFNPEPTTYNRLYKFIVTLSCFSSQTTCRVLWLCSLRRVMWERYSYAIFSRCPDVVLWCGPMWKSSLHSRQCRLTLNTFKFYLNFYWRPQTEG